MSAIILDFESTGFIEPQIVEAAYLVMDDASNPKIQSEFCQRYKPSKAIELGALSTCHIYDEELADCPSHDSFKLPDGVEFIVGHNIDFDWRLAGEPDIKRICTLALSRFLWPEADSHSQSAMIYMHHRADAKELLKSAHSALDDVKNCCLLLRQIVIAITKKYGKCPSTFEDLWRVSERARIPDVMRSGKFKGQKLADVPDWHVKWLLEQQDTDPYLRKALEKR